MGCCIWISGIGLAFGWGLLLRAWYGLLGPGHVAMVPCKYHSHSHLSMLGRVLRCVIVDVVGYVAGSGGKLAVNKKELGTVPTT
ncbi:hypothetical protein B0T22DRAFT_297604 [Podospora appendiculata]|uniref:Uncharacterized protein n=1 Tax=Podospora appendiculata TaxID=314037 RepID=A0AAE0X1R3_9PEZI|nr:hypothetical protein B0T22DRAFT_297604 [Podospora appendiculata]